MKRFIINSPKIRKYAADAVMSIMGDDDMEVIIRENEDDQTASQRAFFHVLIGLLAKDLGNTPAEMKIAIKEEYYGYDTVVVLGKTRVILKSTTESNKEEYASLIETTYRIAAEYGCILPEPFYKK